MPTFPYPTNAAMHAWQGCRDDCLQCNSDISLYLEQVDGVWMLKLPNDGYVEHARGALAMSIRKPNSQVTLDT